MSKVKSVVSKAVLAKHGISHLPYMPLFDRCLVMQIPEVETGGMYGDTQILMPDSIKSSTERAACRGVLLACGAGALDHLRSHNAEVGDTVWFSKFSPWRHVVGYKDGKEIELMFLRSADLAGSEQALERVQDGSSWIEFDEALGEHTWKRDGKSIKRHDTPVDEY